MKRRDFLITGSTGAMLAASGAVTARAKGMMPWDWTDANGPANFLTVDTAPLENELEKYPRCPYCGMMRAQWSHSRHLIVYEDDAVDGTCSIHCAGISLSINMDRGPKVIYAGDAGADAEVKPLVDTTELTYVINPDKMGTMSKVSKWAYADLAKAEAAAAESQNARIADFDETLREAFLGMAEDTISIRKRRAERRNRVSE